jgi:flavin reductase (DIM6/NTAB) family NADH-FMN oxidoreductase RutF
MGFRTILPSDLDPIGTNALLCGGVGPRPIALASTVSPEGVRNLAPFSFFNAFGSNPPTVAFAPNRRGRDGTLKHTYRNAVATGEFVIAAVTYAMVQQVNVASAEYPDGVDEFPKAGLTPRPGRLVRAALVEESPFQMECVLRQRLELGGGPGSGLLLVGEVVAFHVREECFQDGILHPELLDLVGRNGGAYYTRASGAALFRIDKPVGRPIGYDGLPAALLSSRILCGNTLGRLANCDQLPDLSRPAPRDTDPAEPEALEKAIQLAVLGENLEEAWRLVALRLKAGEGDPSR